MYTAVFEGVLSGYCYHEVEKKYYKSTMTRKYSNCTTKVLLFKGTKNVLFLVVQ